MKEPNAQATAPAHGSHGLNQGKSASPKSAHETQTQQEKCPQVTLLLSPGFLPSAGAVLQPVLQTHPGPPKAFLLLASNIYTVHFISRVNGVPISGCKR